MKKERKIWNSKKKTNVHRVATQSITLIIVPFDSFKEIMMN